MLRRKENNHDRLRHYYFVKKLKIVGKNLCKLNCSYG